ncbi:hypothetical protein Sme01_46170 [Sphaerisporangium melleum]|uniref:Uncharacterized protein n=1 Tax=Sphaerisporangium melleum TaxID=321316 RepID=A0A917RDW1_9ACTN|nr:hypothetical protein [Sphaerisporangium melleum]GGL01577.1 hypothetical protein GCM10007964_49580 [Sphaerisporangium melleum]GII72141.1 hypothetical protein Sme01_46170 [Sphaerisporangium melleum]
MNPTRKMWISAGVVGAVLVGGISVAAAAATGRVETDKAGRQSETSTTYAPGEAPGRIPGPDVPANAEPTAPPKVFTDEQMNRDPKKVAEFWTEKRMEEAEPLPIPVITGEKKPK